MGHISDGSDAAYSVRGIEHNEVYKPTLILMQSMMVQITQLGRLMGMMLVVVTLDQQRDPQSSPAKKKLRDQNQPDSYRGAYKEPHDGLSHFERPSTVLRLARSQPRATILIVGSGRF